MLREPETKPSRARLEPTRARVSPTGCTRLDAVLVIGNHLPRQCGIATFTTDLSHAIEGEFSDLECSVLAALYCFEQP